MGVSSSKPGKQSYGYTSSDGLPLEKRAGFAVDNLEGEEDLPPKELISQSIMCVLHDALRTHTPDLAEVWKSVEADAIRWSSAMGDVIFVFLENKTSYPKGSPVRFSFSYGDKDFCVDITEKFEELYTQYTK
jgi:hypothetical protein